MISSDPNDYVIPSDFIELRNAVDETTKLLFGQKYLKTFTKQALVSEVKKLTRAKRRSAVSKLLWQALSTAALAGYLRRGAEADVLHQSYWDGWEAQWRPFLAEPLGRPGAKVYLLHKGSWKDWLETVNWRQQNSVAVIQGESKIRKGANSSKALCSNWLVEQMNQSPKVKPHSKTYYREQALKDFPGVTARNFNDVIWPNAVDQSGAVAWKKAGAPPKTIKSPQPK